METTTVQRRAVPLIGAIAAACMALLLAMTLGVGTASAGGYARPLDQAVKDKGVKTFYFPGKTYKDGNVLDFEGTKSVKVLKFDKKFVKAKVVYGDLQITLKKAGTSNVVIKYGKKKCTLKIKAYKWQFPLKSLKVGGKDYKAKVKKALYGGWCYYTPINGCSVANKTVKLSLSKGWKATINNGETKNGGINTSDMLNIHLEFTKANWPIEFGLGNWD